MSKKKSKNKKRRNTSLKQHKQQGKRLTPPMMTLPNTMLTYWLKDDFPNMLWLCMLCNRYGDQGMVVARNVFDTVEKVLEEEFGSMEAVPKDILVNGTLLSFDTVPEHLREKIINRLKLLSLYESAFPRDFAIALSRYENSPGRWIWGYPEPPKGFSVKELGEAKAMLAKIIEDCWSGYNEKSTWAKMGVTSALFSSGRIHITKEIAEEWSKTLPRYPGGLSDEERKRVEGSMRAMYQGMVRMPSEDNTKFFDWAKEFWRSNWKLYDCEFPPEPEEINEADEATLEKFTKHLDDRLNELSKRFFDAASDDPDLYDPVRYEVLTGIVSRSRRALSIAINNPNMWSTEHGSGVIRGLVEARIVLAWLLVKKDPKLFIQFQEYGRGHLKLLKLHFEEFLDKQATPSPELEAYVAELDKAVNQDISEEFQNISVNANFAGNTNTRKMADEVGLSDDYKFIFAPASSTFHGEWPAVDQFALVLCRNPMHRGHKVVRKDTGVMLGANLIEFAVDQLEDLVERYEQEIQN